ncbi:hypothetical protein BUALT_Bualt14G0056000 [Buddleja alternifolia]|uniref:Uncharacterized protein n=1 Tax=Buddleja alternifolia TaxID=168488 RepID=A0AAV6WLS7_9LAMI|nr:hypothetical protein BUALT_Bualt14G0056000 [Buddleja alternifolia]
MNNCLVDSRSLNKQLKKFIRSILAAAMADAAIQFLLSDLARYISEPITTKIKVFSGDYIEKQKEYLIGEMKDLQKKTQGKQNSNERTKLFARSAADLIYRIEDLVADLNSLMAKSPRVNWLLTDARKVDAQIQEVKDKIDRLSRISLAFDISVEAEAEAENSSLEIQTSTAEWSRETYSHQIDEHYVERVEETHLLRSYLTPGGGDTPCRAVFICGMGGIGKTALAKKLYNDLQYDKRFYAVAWVYVSHNFVPRRILEDLYVKLHPYHREQVSEMEEVALAREVLKIQQNRTCLVVLDDIWSTDAWETLRAAFPSGSVDSPSKLLITTRVAKVAEAVEREADRRYVHKLRCLTESQSLELFQKMVPQEDVPVFETNEILVEIRKKTVEFCEGLPLAIIRFLQFIATKRTLEERMIVHQSFESLVRKSQENGGAEATLQLLSLSYDNLPHYLRPCFLYLGHFQEDSMIEAEKLYLSWEAEGLISLEDCRSEETVKDVAERYLKDLAESSMVELHEEEVPIITRFKSCQLNKLIRDLCLLKNRELGFFKVVDFERGPQLVPNSYSSSSGNEAYRLAINLDMYEEGYNFPLEKNEKKHVRCLLLSTKENKKGLVWPRKLSKLAHFQHLRILDFDGFDFQVTKLPRGIEYLLHLRYLSFRGCILPELPSSIGNLTCLLTLDLRVQSPSEITIPNIIRKLKKLKHLYLPVSFFRSDGGKLGLEGLTELETLINFNPGMINVDDLFQLSKLRYMSLTIAGSIEDIERITERMNKDSDGHTLRTSFKISNFDCYTEEKHSVIRSLLASQSLIIFSMEGHFRWLPLFNKISQNIARIELIGSELIENPMRILEKLPKLRVLVLNDDAFIGKEMVCSKAGFVELKHLELLNLQKLEKWIVEEGAMPKLSILEIGNCGKLKMLPEELPFVCRLQKMKVSGVHEEFKANLRKVYEMMKQDTHRVKNERPIISIDDVQLL